MIARMWHGVVPRAKAQAYGEYLVRSDRGIDDYRRTRGNRGAWLLRREEGEHVHFLLVSWWDSREAIAAYAGPDIDRPRYFDFDRECVLEERSGVRHWEVVAAAGEVRDDAAE